MAEWDASLATQLLHARKGSILSAWERDVRADGTQLPDRDLRAPVETLLDRLIDRVAGDAELPAVYALADAHATQRYRAGLALGALLGEYAHLRLALHASLHELAPLTPLDHALDLVYAHAVECYAALRDDHRERFIGMLAHDLRNPLTCIAIACDMLAGETQRHRQQVYVEQIGDAAGRMQRLVADVLMFARGHLGDGVPVSPRDQDLGEIVRTVIAEMRTIHGDAAVAAEIRGELRGAFDRDRVHQLVANLMRNAIEHGAGKARVFANEAADGRSIVLVVRNRGALKLPDPSAPLRGRTQNRRGLGLYIVDQIARGHGARVELTTTADETAVTVHWPKSARAAQVAAP